jgi:small-conductance mechanosensitive channel
VAFAQAALAIALGAGVLWGISRAHRRLVGRLVTAAERRVARAGLGELELFRRSRLLDFERRSASALFSAVALIVLYLDATFILRRFPFTRPWGESMRGFLISSVENLGLSLVRALPDLFTVVLIVLLARFVMRLVRYWFDAIERGRLAVPWIHPETAQPTRRLLTALLWLFTAVMAYPYLPGSQTEAFKGVSVFIGLMITFGSSGLVNQIVSGFMITYSRALRLGDFVRIGDVEGTVSHLGVLSTKLRTLQSEEVTVPNAVVIAQTTTDYSRTGEAEGVFTPITVTIGYDAAWRQVEALLLMAAERTPGLRTDPKPFVVQTGLEDFYVRYMLLVCLQRQQSRLVTLHQLHANIQDTFNEYGVQIMSPNYMLDPAAPKVVPKSGWAPAPARQAPTRHGA